MVKNLVGRYHAGLLKEAMSDKLISWELKEDVLYRMSDASKQSNY
jgi:hypothetical protein